MIKPEPKPFTRKHENDLIKGLSREFLLDGIIYRPQNDNRLKIDSIIAGIEWQWDWNKKNDLIFRDFPKLLHVKCDLKVLIYRIHNGIFNEEFDWSIKNAVTQINSSENNEFLFIAINLDKKPINNIWKGTAHCCKYYNGETIKPFMDSIQIQLKLE